MKKHTQFLYVALLGFMVSSCGGNTGTEQVEAEETSEPCLYSFSQEHTTGGFTAYKFLGRVGVGGEFQEINISSGGEAEDPIEVIESLSFNIPISGINTKDAGRDDKIREFFFGTIQTDVISGKVVRLNDETASVDIQMNGVTHEVEGEYTLEDNIFKFSAEIDVLDWDAESGIEALNKECYELHIDHEKGDTESKLWSEVSIHFSTELNKNCD